MLAMCLFNAKCSDVFVVLVAYYEHVEHSVICQNHRAQRFHKRKQQSRTSVNTAGKPCLIADWDFARRVAVLQTSEGQAVAKRLQASLPDRKDKSPVIGIFELDGDEVPVPVGLIWWGMVVGQTTTAAGPAAVFRPVQEKKPPAPRRAKSARPRAKSRRLEQGEVAAKAQEFWYSLFVNHISC